MKIEINSLDLDHLYSLRGNYENELRKIESNGYSWQETYYMTERISNEIGLINSLIEKQQHKRIHGINLKPMLGFFSTIVKTYKVKNAWFHLPGKWTIH